MSHPFHYFTPGLMPAQILPGNCLDKKLAATVHLEHWVDAWKKPSALTIQDAQIDGQRGAFFTPTINGQVAPVVTFNPDESIQRWYKTPKIWVGWEVGNEPGPEEMKKSPSEFIPGYFLQDEAGQGWVIPVARSQAGKGTLPNDIEWNLETNQPSIKRKAKYDWLWQLSEEIWDYWNTEARPKDNPWLAAQALKILQVNYYVSAIELNAFAAMGRSVMDEVRIQAISFLFIDLDIVQRVEDAKKNEAISEDQPAS